ncbi:MAG TPA: iron ABC transporter ATP-binding protein [Humibacter sp.]|nr:iron ABC transporter ATP-binding protein [Humibacter sp.]
MTTTSRIRVMATLAACLVGVGLLAGCAASHSPKPAPSPSRTDSPRADPPTPTPTPTPTATPTPVTLTCDQVLTAQQLYDYNPNFGDDPGYKPAAGSLPAQAVQFGGVACGWLNQTSKSVLEASVATPTDDQLTQLGNAAVTSSHVVPTYGSPPLLGYFTISNGAGVAQVFTGKWWIVVSSKDFLEPGDAQPAMSAVLQNLPKG